MTGETQLAADLMVAGAALIGTASPVGWAMMGAGLVKTVEAFAN
jgi:hypothetical protein